jgi:uncharacterized membrane protein
MPANKKKSLFRTLRNYFITGAIVLIPIGITIYLSIFLIKFSSRLLPGKINPNNYLPFDIPGIEILITIIFITIVGGIFNNILKRIPILRTIYSAVGQLTESFAQTKGTKKSVVLIEYPRKGLWAVGFATKDNVGEISKKTNEQLVNVFVPTTPNPTSGFLLMVPKKDIVYLDMSFEEASKFIVSAGTSN